MLPIWIIDLGCSAASEEKLQSLLGSLSESQKPFWHYSRPEERPVRNVEEVKALMEDVVSDGQECYNAFIREGYKVGNFQIVILGSADECFSQDIFAPLAGLVRDYLPSIISDHANLGVEISGILYIPSTVNQLECDDDRRKAALLLEELNTLTAESGPKPYNRVVAYQDVQYYGNRFYPGLDTGQRTEFLFQILCNLFLSGDGIERIFDRIGQDGGIFSLGAASVYYDSGHHKNHELTQFLESLVREFKDTANASDEFSAKKAASKLEEGVCDPDSVSSRLRENCGSLDVDLKKMDGDADPHPVWDLFRSDLIPRYYRKYLKFMPARLHRFLQSLSYILLSRFSAIMKKNREEAVDRLRPALRGVYKEIYLDEGAHYATIAQMESFFEAAKKKIAAFKSKIGNVQLEIVPVPVYLRNDYDKCIADEKENKPSALMDKLKKNLRKEPLVLSLIVRSFLLGILLVFTVIPLIRFLSPDIINLGEIAAIERLWIPLLFFLPLIIEFCIKLRRHFKRIRRIKYRLLASTLLAVNKRLSERLAGEQGEFYDGLSAECDEQLAKLKAFREGLAVDEEQRADGLIPETMFNQPLVGGEFCGEKLLRDESDCEAQVRVHNDSVRISALTKGDLLALLKASFKKPDTISAGDLGDGRDVPVHNAELPDALAAIFGPELNINTAEDAGAMLRQLGDKVNLSAFIKMAGVNGMLFSEASDYAPVVRVLNAPGEFKEFKIIRDVATKDYVFLTSWQKIDSGIQSQMVCNCSLESLPELSIADKLTLLYAYYRRKDLAYTLAGVPVRIDKAEMEELDKQIRRVRL